MRRARACGRFLGPRNFGRRRRRGELLAARLVRQSCCGSPGGAGMVALHLQLLHERVGRCRRVGRARSRDRPPPADDGNGQPVRKPPCPGGPPMDPTELRLRDPGSRRAVDHEHGEFRRLAESRPVRDAAGYCTSSTSVHPLRQHQQLRHRFWRPLSGRGAAMARRRQQFLDLWDRRHSGRRI